MKVPIWHTADGREIPVTEMTDSHIANARNLMERMIRDNEEDPFEGLWSDSPKLAKARKWQAIFQAEQDRRDLEKKNQLDRIEAKIDAMASAMGLELAEEEVFEPSGILKQALDEMGMIESVEADNECVRVTFVMPPLPEKLRGLFDRLHDPFGSIDANGRTVKGKKTAATIKSRRKATRTKVTKEANRAKRGRSEGRSIRRKAVRKTR